MDVKTAMELNALCKAMIEAFEIDSVIQLPEKLRSVCRNNRQEYMEKFSETVEDLSVDWLQKIFQYYEADRKEKKQDYTPQTLARFLGKLTETEQETTVYDLCAGSGALTIQKWNLNHDLHFLCCESDEKVIPVLLFNLAVRNISATVVHGDALQAEVITTYRLKRGEIFATVTESTEAATQEVVDSCLSNPPYNIKWTIPPFAQLQPRFSAYELPPENNANYAFLLTALHGCKGKAAILLPQGALSTSQEQEKEIRKQLIEQNVIAAVISCPDRMFEATDISTCILLLDKKKTTTHISFVDMRNTCKTVQREQRGQFGGASHEKRVYKKEVKTLTDEQIQKAIQSITEQSAIPEFSKSVSAQTVAENEYILTPSRYIELQTQELQHREYAHIIADLNRVIEEKNGLKLTVNESLAKSMGLYELFLLFKQSEDHSKALNAAIAFTGKKISGERFLSLSKKAGELKIENGSKETVSTILLSILQMWKQHIMYLNNEENRYLAELRDALLPDLFSGKIDLQTGETEG